MIQVMKHTIFGRQGDNLSCIKMASFAQACLGAKVEVPTIYGETVEVNIPPGTQYGQVLRIKQKGLPSLRGGGQKFVGDQLVEIRISVPKDIPNKARKSLEEFDKNMKVKKSKKSKK